MARWPKLAVGALLAAVFAATSVNGQDRLDPVGLRQITFSDGDRSLALALFYPAKREGAIKPLIVPFFTNVAVLPGAPILEGARRPLILFSHGRGSNGMLYAWFAEYLAVRGFVVAAIDHYRANTYDSNIAYLANRLWQRPVDVKLAISFLLDDPGWGALTDADRIGVAGHSQGGKRTVRRGGGKSARPSWPVVPRPVFLFV